MTGWLNNVSLKKKLLLIMGVGFFVMAAMSFFIIQLLSHSYEKMMCRMLTESLSYSAKEITDYLEKMDQLSQIILSDDDVQTHLGVLKDADSDSIQARNSLQKAGISLGAYYQNYADGIIRYMSLYTSKRVLKTNLLQADKVPEDIQNEILERAEEHSGAMQMVTQYIDEYGLFLARDIRRIEGLKLDTLGTLLISIDMDTLIRSCTGLARRYGDNAYVIYADGELIYHTKSLTVEEVQRVRMDEMEDYAIRKIGDGSYFIARGKISAYDWDYYALVSYDEIKQQIAHIKQICAVIIILDFLMIMLLSTRLIGRLMQHISGLKQRMQAFAEDNSVVPKARYDYAARRDEIGTLNRQFDKMSRTIIRLIEQNYTNVLLKREAQLKALENQINPHFLYNTLDSVRWRAKLHGEEEIARMVESLGLLLRTTLSRRGDESYTVGEEMEIISSYITIQKIRYEERLSFDNQVPADLYAFHIPRLSIQPLVENAIFYGLEVNVDACKILLSAKQQGGVCHFYVKNTGSEMEEDLLTKLEREEIKPHGHGVGLLNIDKRIKIQYGSAYGLRLYNEAEYAVAELAVPLKGQEG